ANLYESCLRINYSDRFADDATAAALVKQTGRLDFDKYWDLLEKDMQDSRTNGPYLLGNQYSVIDPYLLMLIGWHEHPGTLLERSPNLAALFNAVQQRSAVSKIWDQNTRKTD
ncbi:MAG: glutathione S-transferase, partial [Gammaproteobacteria bacterium]